MRMAAFEGDVRHRIAARNVKFMLEGEEEIGSSSLYDFCRRTSRMLKADIILVSDTSMISMQTPRSRAACAAWPTWEVEVTGPERGDSALGTLRCGGQSGQRAGAPSWRG